MKKVIAIVVSMLIALWAVNVWYNLFVSARFYVTAPLYQTAFLLLILPAGLYLLFKITRWVIKTDLNNLLSLLMIPVVFATLEGCTYAKMNQIVLYSEDCGVNWKQVPAGSHVPTGTTNPCFVKETMPGYEMQGEMEYFVLFKEQVKVKIRLTYSYLIEDPILFMKSAKKLGRTNADADDAQEDNERFEGAENRVIETKIKKITSDEFPKEDVVAHDMNALELTYAELVNNELKSRGVNIVTFEMVPEYQPLTQQAIDAANADRIYSSKGMQEFGRQITIARAGAPQINFYDKVDN